MDVRVAFNQTLYLQTIVNVMCFGNAIEDPVEGQAFADQVRVRYNTHIVADLVDNWTLHSISVTYFPGGGPYTVTYPFTSGPLTGASAQDGMPAQICMVGSLIHVGSRPNRGRVFQGGYPETGLTDGIFGNTQRTHLQDLLTDFANGVEVAGNVWNLRIGRRNPTTPGYAITNPVDLVIARSNPGVQRSRRLSFL